jgi:PAS domain S-box-containing protein
MAASPTFDEVQYLETLFERMHDAVFIIGMDMQCITVNQAAANMLGYTREEMVGMHPNHITSPEYVKSADENISRLLRGEQLEPFERVLMRKDGSRFPAEVSTHIVRDLHGTPRYFQSIVRDITQRKNAEHQSLELALELERSRILAEFIMAASHEFRNPLSQINTSLHIMRRTSSDPAFIRRIDQTQQSVDRISDLVSRMLLLVKLESSSSQQIRTIDIAEALYEAEISHTLNLQTKSLRITRSIAPDLPHIAADAHGLHIALREMLDNAIKASPVGGTITLGGELQGDFVVITIHDDGTGIAPTDIKYIFDRFFRGDKSHNQPGFGLGLSIAKLVIDQHGGMIDVFSVPGKGTTFRILLPHTAK